MAVTNSSMQTVLIVNDSEVVRMLARALFEVKGWQVYEADDGSTACDFLKSGVAVDWIFLDIMMPVMNGYQFLEWFSEQQHSARIIVLTANVQVDKSALLYGYGGAVVDVLHAPIDPRTMLPYIDRLAG